MEAKKPYVVFMGGPCVDKYFDAEAWPEIGNKVSVWHRGNVCGGLIANAACVCAGYGIETYSFDIKGDGPDTEMLFEDMEKHGYTREQLDSVYTPIGLAIGAETPAEIAVAIAAELVQVKASFGSDSAWDKPMLEAVAGLGDKPAALTVIIKREGSTPRGAGSRMLVYEDGSIVGTIGGGKSEADAMAMAGDVLQGGATGMYHCAMNNKDAAGLGLICGGEIDVFIEKIN